jgi:predicted nucleic acid-binding protein
LKYQSLILKKTNADLKDVDSLISNLFAYINILPLKAFERSIKRSEKIMRDIDMEDAVFVACALSLPDSVIWSNDRHLKKQNLVKVYNTKEILKIL